MALIGLGFRSISVAPASVGPIKAMVLSLDAGQLAERLDALLAGGETSLREDLKRFAAENGVDLAHSYAYGAHSDDSVLLHSIGQPCVIHPGLEEPVQVAGNREYALKKLGPGRYSLDIQENEEAGVPADELLVGVRGADVLLSLLTEPVGRDVLAEWVERDPRDLEALRTLREVDSAAESEKYADRYRFLDGLAAQE